MSNQPKSILLLDIDYTTFCEEKPRPFLREFIEQMSETHQIGFYTAASSDRLMFVLRHLYHKMELPDDVVKKIQRHSLDRTRCPMVKDETGTFEYKCLRKAAEVIRVDPSQITLLDDMPMHDNPDVAQRIQAPGFWGQENDTYLRDLTL